MALKKDGIDEHLGRLFSLVPNEFFGLIAVKEEASENEDEDAAAEKKTELPFEARFAQQSSKAAIRHEVGLVPRGYTLFDRDTRLVPAPL